MISFLVSPLCFGVRRRPLFAGRWTSGPERCAIARLIELPDAQIDIVARQLAVEELSLCRVRDLRPYQERRDEVIRPSGQLTGRSGTSSTLDFGICFATQPDSSLARCLQGVVVSPTVERQRRQGG